ncbi:uncharacterized protein LOC126834678 isoform X2 [Adelges cooleyi]|uniref:uncharacterized protein LOC126834678 isoform X2 n=1 Tax=Adelges cooleyi TaxID=133065 RepID=UPI00217F499A|nr:uncharacterized protein LOC126834678 isoform X2 [Adelges cooleyi]
MALVANLDGPTNLLDERNANNCENENEEDIEDGEIFDEEDEGEVETKVPESCEKTSEMKQSLVNENCPGEGPKEKDFEQQWDSGSRSQQSYSKMHMGTSKPFAGFNNSRPRTDRFPRNKGSMIKRDFGHQMDDDRPRRKRRRFDQIDEKEPLNRNNGIFNKRKNNDNPVEPADGVNEDEMLYVRGASPESTNFESFSRDFEDGGGEDFRHSRDNNFGRRGRGRRGGIDIDRRNNRGMGPKRRMGSGPPLKVKRPEDEEKICQYFLQGKCLKENNCTYSHQQPNGRKMELCKFYLMDRCSKEDRCTFMHSEFPCKYFHTGMKCYSEPNCRFSHAKLDDDQKKMLLKSFGKIRYDPPDYDDFKTDDFKNKYEEEPKAIVENNFNVKNDKNKIPSLLEMQIPVPPALKTTEKNNSEDDSEANNNNNSTPMPSPSRDEIVDNNFEINENEQFTNSQSNSRSLHRSRKHDKKQKHNKAARKKHREERYEQKRLEKSRHRKEELPMSIGDPIMLDELSDNDDEFNDLVIDEEKFPNESKEQQLPKKQKELLKRIQVQQKYYNDTEGSDDHCSNHEDHYSSDSQDPSAPNSINNLLSSLQNSGNEPFPTCSVSGSQDSKVEQVDLNKITISEDIAKLLNSIKAKSGNDQSIKEQTSPFHLNPLEQPFEEPIQEKNICLVESPASPTSNSGTAMELGKSDVDLRQLPFQFPAAAATEIQASIDSHPPMKYQLVPTQVSVPDYSKIPPTMGIDDPRLRRSIAAARDPMFSQSAPVAVATIIRQAAPQKSAPRDPRKPQQDVNPCTSVLRPPLLPTPNTLVHQRPMDSDMRHMPSPIMCPQMMAVPNDPRRKQAAPGDPRQRHRFDVDQRINNMNNFNLINFK